MPQSDVLLHPATPAEFTICMFQRMHQLRHLTKGATSADQIRGLVLLVVREILIATNRTDKADTHALSAVREFVRVGAEGNVEVDGAQLFAFCHPTRASAWALAQVFFENNLTPSA
jgi:hypothetical protein